MPLRARSSGGTFEVCRDALVCPRPGIRWNTNQFARGAVRMESADATLRRLLAARSTPNYLRIESVMRPAWSSLCISIVAISTAVSASGCKRRYEVGDKVLVEWEKNTYPAVILETNGPTKIKVHYEGYDPVWDETVPRDRIKGFNDGNAPHPEPPPKVRAKALQAAQTNVYKIGDRVRVEWHGTTYPAVIVGIVGQERYRVHFEGYGDEWDDTVGLNRIQQR